MSVFKTAFNHIRRSPYQSLLMVVVLTFSFFLMSVVVILGYVSQEVLNFFESKPQIVAYLDDKATMEEVNALKNKLEETGKVDEIKYVSKEEALSIYQEANKDNPLLLEMVTADILPASLEISATNIAYLKDLAAILENEPIISVSEGGKKEIDFQEDIAQALRRWNTTVRRVGLIVGVFLAGEAFLLILVITSMKIALRAEEVTILRLLGASSWYTSAPFLIEGIFYGLWGAILGFALAYFLLIKIQPTAASFLGEANVFPLPQSFLLSVLAATTLFSSLLCGFASFVATRRYLK